MTVKPQDKMKKETALFLPFFSPPITSSLVWHSSAPTEVSLSHCHLNFHSLLLPFQAFVPLHLPLHQPIGSSYNVIQSTIQSKKFYKIETSPQTN